MRGCTPALLFVRRKLTVTTLLLALFAHGHVLRALAARWVQEPVSFGGRLFLSTGSICVLGFEREVRVIRRWNET